eukprot:15179764-Alexandrium_andersonii.AAC.1
MGAAAQVSAPVTTANTSCAEKLGAPGGARWHPFPRVLGGSPGCTPTETDVRARCSGQSLCRRRP